MAWPLTLQTKMLADAYLLHAIVISKISESNHIVIKCNGFMQRVSFVVNDIVCILCITTIKLLCDTYIYQQTK